MRTNKSLFIFILYGSLWVVSCYSMPAGIHNVILHLNQFFSLFFRFLQYQLFLCASLDIQLPKGTPAYHLTWQFCYAARQEANKWTEGSEITKSTSHWTDILLDPKATNNIQFNTIDIIQAEAAQKWKITMLKTEIRIHACMCVRYRFN